ncbi:MAG: GyrI-like domain-containing protein [Oscillospiraceae bacterium]|jgi:hypothetical protein|nr:GyrI-like domain-containing protein [Oscillospiraceae bacterium]
MEYIRIYNFPACKMASSGDFSPWGTERCRAFEAWFNTVPITTPYTMDFLREGDTEGSLCWMYLLSDGLDVPPEFETVDFPGGLYAVVCDIDRKTPDSTWKERDKFLKKHGFERDFERPEFGHIVGPPEALDYGQMDYWYPIRKKDS